MYIDNTWYGARYIFSKYCKVNDKTAFASIQHGHVIVNEKNLGKKKINASPWLVWNKKIANRCLRNGFKNIIPVGSAFVYLEKIYKFKTKKPQGTLVFPLLSQPEVKNEINYLDIYKDIKKKFPGPYTISVSVRDIDFLKKKYKKLKRLNFVTWGSRGSKNYLKKLYINIKYHKKILCIYPGSAIIYSLYLNKKVYLTKKLYLETKDKEYIKQVRKNLELNIRDFQNYGLNFSNLNLAKNIRLSKKILGVDQIRTPDQLKKLLGWNSIAKSCIAKILSLMINLKEDLFHGLNNSSQRRQGKDIK